MCALRAAHGEVVRNMSEMIPVCVQSFAVVSRGFWLCGACKS